MAIIVNLYEVEFTLNAFAGYDHITVLIHPSLASQNIVHTCCNLLPMIFLVVPVVIYNILFQKIRFEISGLWNTFIFFSWSNLKISSIYKFKYHIYFADHCCFNKFDLWYKVIVFTFTHADEKQRWPWVWELSDMSWVLNV